MFDRGQRCIALPLARCEQRNGGLRIRREVRPFAHQRPRQHRGLRRLRHACGRLLERPHQLRRVATGPPHDPLSKRARRLDKLHIVQQHQRLKRRVRARAINGADLAVGRIKQRHARWRERALPIAVHAAAIELLAVILMKGLRRCAARTVVADLAPRIAGRVRIHSRAADLRNQQPARLQRCVANRLCTKAKARTARQHSVVRIMRERVGRRHRRLPIGLAQHDQLQQSLHIPSMLDEVARQPIDERRMGRPLALRAEIVGGAHDARAKQHLPKAIHRHPRRQWIRRARDPLGQTKTILARIRRHRRQRGRRTALNLGARIGVDPAMKNEGFARGRRAVHHQCRKRVGAHREPLARVAQVNAHPLHRRRVLAEIRKQRSGFVRSSPRALLLDHRDHVGRQRTAIVVAAYKKELHALGGRTSAAAEVHLRGHVGCVARQRLVESQRDVHRPIAVDIGNPRLVRLGVEHALGAIVASPAIGRRHARRNHAIEIHLIRRHRARGN